MQKIFLENYIDINAESLLYIGLKNVLCRFIYGVVLLLFKTFIYKCCTFRIDTVAVYGLQM